VCWLPDIETGFIAGDAEIARLDPFHASARRAVTDDPLEARERFGFPFSAYFEAAVRQVANPAVKPFPRRGIAGEESEPHPLNSAADDELTGVAHAGEGRLYPAGRDWLPPPVILPLVPLNHWLPAGWKIEKVRGKSGILRARAQGGTDLAYSSAVRTRPDGGTEPLTTSQRSLSQVSQYQQRAPVPLVPPIAASAPDPETPSARLQRCPVLIVEDDADLREMMAQLLAVEGFRTETVANGREALDYLSQGQFPEVILLDLMMPVMDGWEFRRQQRGNPQLASLPVVVLSALDAPRVAEMGTAFLKKPLDFDRLVEMVRRYCRDADC
jgi:CheY-like chemotaxis protein